MKKGQLVKFTDAFVAPDPLYTEMVGSFGIFLGRRPTSLGDYLVYSQVTGNDYWCDSDEIEAVE